MSAVTSSLSGGIRDVSQDSQLSAQITLVDVGKEFVTIRGTLQLASGSISIARPDSTDPNIDTVITAQLAIMDNASASDDTFLQRVVSSKISVAGCAQFESGTRSFSTDANGTGVIRKTIVSLRWVGAIPIDAQVLYPGLVATFEVVIGKIRSSNASSAPTSLMVSLISKTIGRVASNNVAYVSLDITNPSLANGLNVQMSALELEQLGTLDTEFWFENVQVDAAAQGGSDEWVHVPANVYIGGRMTINVPATTAHSFASAEKKVGSGSATAVDNTDIAAIADLLDLPYVLAVSTAGTYSFDTSTLDIAEISGSTPARSTTVYKSFYDFTNASDADWTSAQDAVLPSLEIAGAVAGGVVYYGGLTTKVSSISGKLMVSGTLIGLPISHGSGAVAFRDLECVGGLITSVDDSVLKIGGAGTITDSLTYKRLPFIRSSMTIIKSGVYVPIESCSTELLVEESSVKSIKNDLSMYKDDSDAVPQVNFTRSDTETLDLTITKNYLPATSGVTNALLKTAQMLVENAKLDDFFASFVQEETIVFSSCTVRQVFDVTASHNKSTFMFLSDGAEACSINRFYGTSADTSDPDTLMNVFYGTGRVKINHYYDLRSVTTNTTANLNLFDCDMKICMMYMSMGNSGSTTDGGFFGNQTSMQNSTLEIGTLEILNDGSNSGLLNINLGTSTTLTAGAIGNTRLGSKSLIIRKAYDKSSKVTQLVTNGVQIDRFELAHTADFVLACDNSDLFLKFADSATAIVLSSTNHIYNTKLRVQGRTIDAALADTFDDLSSFEIANGSVFNYNGMKETKKTNSKDVPPPHLIVAFAIPSGSVATKTTVMLPEIGPAGRLRRVRLARTKVYNRTGKEITVATETYSGASTVFNTGADYKLRPVVADKNGHFYSAKHYTGGYTELCLGAVEAAGNVGHVLNGVAPVVS